VSDEITGNRDAINALGLDFGDIENRVEAVREDGSFVVSKLSEFGKSLADKSQRAGRGWKNDQGFNPFSVPRKRDTSQQLTVLDEAMERMFAPVLYDFCS
jgi:hypothetical protein